MTAAALLVAATVAALIGLGWLALAMDAHWQQVRGDAPLPARTQHILRILGVTAISASLVLCLMADHPTMAALVWVMALAGSALVVAFTLSWRPALLLPLLVFE